MLWNFKFALAIHSKFVDLFWPFFFPLIQILENCGKMNEKYLANKSLNLKLWLLKISYYYSYSYEILSAYFVSFI